MLQLVKFTLIALTMKAGVIYAQTANISKPSSEVTIEGAQVDKVNADKKTILNFEDELIEGTAQKPDLFYLFQNNNFKFKKLIRLRENFLPEMKKNAEDIQRLRGGR